MQIILKILPFMFFSLLILLLSPIVLSRRVESSIEMLIYILIFLYATILLLIKESHYVYQCFIHDVCLFLTYYDLFIYFLYFIYKYLTIYLPFYNFLFYDIKLCQMKSLPIRDPIWTIISNGMGANVGVPASSWLRHKIDTPILCIPEREDFCLNKYFCV